MQNAHEGLWFRFTVTFYKIQNVETPQNMIE